MTRFQRRVRRERLQTNSFHAQAHLRNNAPNSRRPSSPPDDSQFSYVNRCAISDSMRTVCFLGASSAGSDHVAAQAAAITMLTAPYILRGPSGRSRPCRSVVASTRPDWQRKSQRGIKRMVRSREPSKQSYLVNKFQVYAEHRAELKFKQTCPGPHCKQRSKSGPSASKRT